MDFQFCINDIFTLYGKNITKIKKLSGYGDKINFLAENYETKEKFVFKVKFSKVDNNRDDLINQALNHLYKNGFKVPLPCLRRLNIKQEEIEIFKYVFDKGLSNDVSDELISFVPGSVLGLTKFNLTENKTAAFNLGKYVADMNNYLKIFQNQIELKRDDSSVFLIQNTLLLRNYLHLVKDENLLNIVKFFLDQFEAKVLNKLTSLRKGLIHGDTNDLNITEISHELVTKENADLEEIKKGFGLFDFEDSHFGYYVFELAICMMYMITTCNGRGHNDCWMVGGKVLAGYNLLFPLTESELEVLYLSVASRFCVSLVMSYTHPKDLIVDNDLLFFHSSLCKPLLEDMFEKGSDVIMEIWKNEIQKTL